MKVFSSDIKFLGDDDFSKRFNAVSDWFARWKREQTDESWNDYFKAKYCLEQGLPVPLLPDPSNHQPNEQQ